MTTAEDLSHWDIYKYRPESTVYARLGGFPWWPGKVHSHDFKTGKIEVHLFGESCQKVCVSQTHIMSYTDVNSDDVNANLSGKALKRFANNRDDYELAMSEAKVNHAKYTRVNRRVKQLRAGMKIVYLNMMRGCSHEEAKIIEIHPLDVLKLLGSALPMELSTGYPIGIDDQIMVMEEGYDETMADLTSFDLVPGRCHTDRTIVERMREHANETRDNLVKQFPQYEGVLNKTMGGKKKKRKRYKAVNDDEAFDESGASAMASPSRHRRRRKHHKKRRRKQSRSPDNDDDDAAKNDNDVTTATTATATTTDDKQPTKAMTEVEEAKSGDDESFEYSGIQSPPTTAADNVDSDDDDDEDDDDGDLDLDDAVCSVFVSSQASPVR